MRIATHIIVPETFWQRAPTLLVLASMLALAGCVAMYGIGRTAPLAMLPDPDCVEVVLRQSPEVAHVQRREAINEEIAYYRTGNATIYTVNYRDAAETDTSEIRLMQFGTGGFGFDNLYITTNRKPKQADIDKVRPAMLAIEQRLADRCDMHNLPSTVSESCSGVVCKPIP